MVNTKQKELESQSQSVSFKIFKTLAADEMKKVYEKLVKTAKESAEKLVDLNAEKQQLEKLVPPTVDVDLLKQGLILDGTIASKMAAARLLFAPKMAEMMAAKSDIAMSETYAIKKKLRSETDPVKIESIKKELILAEEAELRVEIPRQQLYDIENNVLTYPGTDKDGNLCQKDILSIPENAFQNPNIDKRVKKELMELIPLIEDYRGLRNLMNAEKNKPEALLNLEKIKQTSYAASLFSAVAQSGVSFNKFNAVKFVEKCVVIGSLFGQVKTKQGSTGNRRPSPNISITYEGKPFASSGKIEIQIGELMKSVKHELPEGYFNTPQNGFHWFPKSGSRMNKIADVSIWACFAAAKKQLTAMDAMCHINGHQIPIKKYYGMDKEALIKLVQTPA